VISSVCLAALEKHFGDAFIDLLNTSLSLWLSAELGSHSEAYRFKGKLGGFNGEACGSGTVPRRKLKRKE
jgi:hypothetical protein